MFETDVMRALDRRVAALERELRDHQEAANAVPCLALRELKKQVDTFRKKLETTEHLSWLGKSYIAPIVLVTKIHPAPTNSYSVYCPLDRLYNP